jgi:hypothetical protein
VDDPFGDERRYQEFKSKNAQLSRDMVQAKQKLMQIEGY